jgi:hypothetical protein
MTDRELMFLFTAYSLALWLCGFMVARRVYSKAVRELAMKLAIQRLAGNSDAGKFQPC